MILVGPCQLEQLYCIVLHSTVFYWIVLHFILVSSILCVYSPTNYFAIWNYFIVIRQAEKWRFVNIILQNWVRWKYKNFCLQVSLLNLEDISQLEGKHGEAGVKMLSGMQIELLGKLGVGEGMCMYVNKYL